MIIDHRTYTLHPTKMRDWLQLWQEEALPVELQFCNLVGFFKTEIGPLNQVVHMWSYDDLNDRQERRDAMWADPEWLKFVEKNKALDALRNTENKILIPTEFSPIR